MSSVLVYDPTATDEASRVRGIGRYVQILRENFPSWQFTNNVTMKQFDNDSVLINPFINFLQTPIIKKRSAKKQIAVIHDLITLKYPTHFPTGLRGRWNIARNKVALQYYDAFVTDSEASRQDIVSHLGISENKVHVIYPCLPKVFEQRVDGSRLTVHGKAKTVNSELRTENFFLYVGDVTWNKNLVNLARALKKADKTCVFVGKAFADVTRYTLHATQNPWLKEYREFMEIATNDKHFIFPGFVSDEHLTHLYRSARANILISRDEGFGFSYLEAASLGTPSILSDIPVFREIARETGIFVNPADVESIIQALQSITLTTKDTSKKLQERARSFSSSEFKKDWENVTI